MMLSHSFGAASLFSLSLSLSLSQLVLMFMLILLDKFRVVRSKVTMVGVCRKDDENEDVTVTDGKEEVVEMRTTQACAKGSLS